MNDEDKKAVNELLRRWMLTAAAFAHATLKRETKFHEWNGEHPVDSNTVVKTYPAGTRVLVAMVSRFGDVGIRARNIERIAYGYDCRVELDELEAYELK